MRLVKRFGDFPVEEAYLRVILNPEFKEASEEIRAKFGIDLNEIFEEGEEGQNKLLTYEQDFKIINEVKNLARRFNFPDRWTEYLTPLVVSGQDVFDNPDALSLIIDLDEQEDRLASKFYLEINEKTNLREIKKLWPKIQKDIKKYGIRDAKNRRPWKKIWRDYWIWKLVSEGKGYSEINAFLKERFNEESIDLGNMKKIASSFLKKLNNRKAP